MDNEKNLHNIGRNYDRKYGNNNINNNISTERNLNRINGTYGTKTTGTKGMYGTKATGTTGIYGVKAVGTRGVYGTKATGTYGTRVTGVNTETAGTYAARTVRTNTETDSKYAAKTVRANTETDSRYGVGTARTNTKTAGAYRTGETSTRVYGALATKRNDNRIIESISRYEREDYEDIQRQNYQENNYKNEREINTRNQTRNPIRGSNTIGKSVYYTREDNFVEKGIDVKRRRMKKRRKQNILTALTLLTVAAMAIICIIFSSKIPTPKKGREDNIFPTAMASLGKDDNTLNKDSDIKTDNIKDGSLNNNDTNVSNTNDPGINNSNTEVNNKDNISKDSNANKDDNTTNINSNENNIDVTNPKATSVPSDDKEGTDDKNTAEEEPKKVIAFTFDDGPYPPVTNRILDVLEEYNMSATFFVMGDRTDDYPDTIKKESETTNCQVGNHTYGHKNLTKLTKEGIAEQVNGSAKLIGEITNDDHIWLRPPYGSKNSFVAENVDVPMILWSVDSRDWESKNADKVIEEILSVVKDGDIVLMHDLYPSTAEAVEKLVPKLVEMDFKIVSVKELFEIKGITAEDGKWYYNAKE